MVQWCLRVHRHISGGSIGAADTEKSLCDRHGARIVVMACPDILSIKTMLDKNIAVLNLYWYVLHSSTFISFGLV